MESVIVRNRSDDYMKTEGSGKGRKKAYMFDDSCAICGSRHIDSGRIFHGHCVCEECVDYILSEPENAIEASETGEEEQSEEAI